MKLNEKIYYCRKKAGLSQEILAEMIGVSRQAVSKWETGDAIPEIPKFAALAKVFGVSADWLLSEDEPEDEKFEENNSETSEKFENSDRYSTSDSATTWIDSIPGIIGKLLRKYGWLSGITIAAGGAMFTGIGALAKFIVGKIFGISSGSSDIETVVINGIEIPTQSYDLFGEMTTSMVENNPVSIMATFIIGIGIIMMIGGIVLAIILKRKDK